MTNVTNIEDLRLTRAERSYAPAACQHLQLTMTAAGEIVTCDDCHQQVSAYWALGMFLNYYSRASAKLKSREQAQATVEARTVVLKAAQLVETAWRSRTYVPGCPHCGEAIYPADGFGRSPMINRAMADRRRAARAAMMRAEREQRELNVGPV